MKILLVALLTLGFLQDSRPASRPTSRLSSHSADDQAGPRPVLLENLEPPARNNKGVEPPPPDGFIERNGGVAGRFTEEGTDVEYTFEARRGEVSLFMLSTWGYARGWQSTAEMRVLDAAGFELTSRMRHSGTRYQLFMAFEAPRDGQYRCQLRAAEQYYRYTLVRHSDFPASHGERVALGQGSRQFGFLADSTSRVVFEVDLEEGREVALQVVNAASRTRRIAATRRNEKALEGSNTDSLSMRSAPGSDSASDRDWPDLALRVIGATEGGERSPHFMRFLPERTGTHQIEVFCESQGDGGIFELEIERDLEIHSVQGQLADKQARREAGVELRFYREPDMGLAGFAVSDAQGHFTTAVPSGAYTVTLRRPGYAASSLRTNILAPRELNAIYSTNAQTGATSRPAKR